MTIIKPIITEKSMMAARSGLFTFQVKPEATKSQVKQVVTDMFKVNVLRVNMSVRHVPAKHTGAKRLAGNDGKTKFATVKVKAGQTIDLFDVKESK